MLPLLASGDPFKHTWNTWLIEFYGHDLDLRNYEICRKLGITNAVVMMLFAALVLTFVGVSAGAEARRAAAEGRAMRGFAGAIETVVVFVRDSMMRPNMPHHFQRPFFIALFSTMFFFILTCNLLGLLPQPFGHTATGTPWVNMALAFGVTFLVGIVGAGIWEKGPIHFFTGLVPHGVPLALWPLLFVIELVGLVVKPFALTIRLTANMTAGHIILAVLSGFLLGMGASVGASIGAGASALGFLAITAFEIAIAFIQAYIFTILSTVFVGQSLSHEH
jgi:F-type H+-transporting ATPase subunit a